MSVLSRVCFAVGVGVMVLGWGLMQHAKARAVGENNESIWYNAPTVYEGKNLGRPMGEGFTTSETLSRWGIAFMAAGSLAAAGAAPRAWRRTPSPAAAGRQSTIPHLPEKHRAA